MADRYHTLRRAEGTFKIKLTEKDGLAGLVELYTAERDSHDTYTPVDIAHPIRQGPLGLEVVWQNGQKYETLVWNPTGPCYWGFDTLRGMNGQTYVTQDIRFCFCPKNRYINWMIPKNSITAQLATIIQSNLGYRSREPWADKNINRHISYYTHPYGSHANQSYMSGYKTFRDYTRYIIYRDPVDRFVTLANYTYQRHYWLGRNYRTRRVLTPQEHVAEMILFARVINQSTPARWHALSGEEHTYGQWRVLQHLAPADVDYMVHIDDVTQFMREVLHVEPVAANVSRNHRVTCDTLTEAQRDEVKAIYSDDYKLLGRFADKLWGRLKGGN